MFIHWDPGQSKTGALKNRQQGPDFHYLTIMKVREVFRLLKADGWYLCRTRGSHRQFKHPVKPGLVTLPGKLRDELAKGTLKSIFKQANIRKQ